MAKNDIVEWLEKQSFQLFQRTVLTCSKKRFSESMQGKHGKSIYKRTVDLRTMTDHRLTVSFIANEEIYDFAVAFDRAALIFCCFALFALGSSRCFHYKETESDEQNCTNADEPICHSVVSGLRQIDFRIRGIRTDASFRINGVNVQHAAIFVSQCDLIRTF